MKKLALLALVSATLSFSAQSDFWTNLSIQNRGVSLAQKTLVAQHINDEPGQLFFLKFTSNKFPEVYFKTTYLRGIALSNFQLSNAC
jgi:hypothetical protein